ncbi:putative zinc-binding protein [Candidatus Latescibacterota bacterium]
MPEKNQGCECVSAPTLIFPCSGAADVGEISDRIARRLSREGIVKMSCLAGIGAQLSGFVESAKAARVNITIDGCPVACSSKTIENLGLEPKSFVLTDMGLVKGKTPVDDHVIQELSEAIKKTLTEENVNATDKKPFSKTGGCCSS